MCHTNVRCWWQGKLGEGCMGTLCSMFSIFLYIENCFKKIKSKKIPMGYFWGGRCKEGETFDFVLNFTWNNNWTTGLSFLFKINGCLLSCGEKPSVSSHPKDQPQTRRRKNTTRNPSWMKGGGVKTSDHRVRGKAVEEGCLRREVWVPVGAMRKDRQLPTQHTGKTQE